jgi:hypothetical protein
MRSSKQGSMEAMDTRFILEAHAPRRIYQTKNYNCYTIIPTRVSMTQMVNTDF